MRGALFSSTEVLNVEGKFRLNRRLSSCWCRWWCAWTTRLISVRCCSGCLPVVCQLSACHWYRTVRLIIQPTTTTDEALSTIEISPWVPDIVMCYFVHELMY